MPLNLKRFLSLFQLGSFSKRFGRTRETSGCDFKRNRRNKRFLNTISTGRVLAFLPALDYLLAINDQATSLATDTINKINRRNHRNVCFKFFFKFGFNNFGYLFHNAGLWLTVCELKLLRLLKITTGCFEKLAKQSFKKEDSLSQIAVLNLAVEQRSTGW